MLVGLALLLSLFLVRPAAATDFDLWWQRYHAAGEPLLRQAAWEDLERQGWPRDFERTVGRLQERSYSSGVPTGVLRLNRRDPDGRDHPYTLLVPEDYDPAVAHAVRVVLHGSTRRPAWREGEDHWPRTGPFAHSGTITVFPAAWDEAMWWSERQVDNLRAILDRVRADYRVDSDRCTLTGLSDGGTGTFYHALKAPTPWAAYLPLIGHPWVLGNPEEEVDGDIFASTLAGRALFVVNGEDDRLYPAGSLRSYLDLFRRAGAELRVSVQPGGHTVRWWPEMAPAFARFRQEHPRHPHPSTLVWETGDPRRFGRAFWLVIHEIGEAPAPDPDPLNTVLFPELDPPTRAQAFPRQGPSGRVSLRREGNTIHAETRNVRRFELLLPVGLIDFERPVEVVVDGRRERHRVQPSVETLRRWAVRDGDPRLLYGASLMIDVP